MFGEPKGPERGDKIGDFCHNCGDRYDRVVGGRGHRKYCSDCATEKEKFKDLEKVGGTWTVRSEDNRERIVALLEQEFIVDVDETNPRIQCYTRPNGEQ